MRLSIKEAEVQVVVDADGVRVLMSDTHGPLELVMDRKTAGKLRDGLNLVVRDDEPRRGGPMPLS
ncbi:MAG: hypothetical protein K6T83_17770 [Alicyclobacillus sp.]|nr:hypothetical protein [Alicyclobacillus sp.]